MPNLTIRRLAIVLAATLVACVEEPPTASSPEAAFAVGASNRQLGETSLDLIERDYDDGLLDRDNASRYRMYAVAAPERLPPRYRSNNIGKDATLSFVRLAQDWARLSPAARAEISALQAKGFGDLKHTLNTAHFTLHYATTGASAVPAQDGNGNGTPDYIEIAAQSLETIWTRLVGQLGYPAPKGTPQDRYHVYFKDLPYYGYTSPIDVELLSTSPIAYGTATSYIVIENDFFGFPRNDEDVTGQEPIRSGALKVTQAHEFMHAIQFNINVYQSGWLMESHATWTEDIVYDHVNDWHWYIPRFFSRPDLPLFNRFVYGSAFYMHHLSETRGVDVQRQIWEAARTSSTPDAVRTAAYGGSWEPVKDFAAVEFLLDLSDFTKDGPSVIPTPTINSHALHQTYPVAVTVPPSTKQQSNLAPWGLGANFIHFAATTSGRITIGFDGADGYAWRASVIAIGTNGNKTTIYPITLNSASAGSIELNGLGTKWSRLVLAPTIADRPGVAVPYAYTATVNAP